MRGSTRGTASPALAAAVLAAAVLAAGCSAGPAVPYQATVYTCFTFGVHALNRHVTVATVPRACAGLSHAQVNVAVARAVREVAGPAPKAVGRRLAIREGRYLARLINTVPPPRPAPQAVAPGGRSSDLPLSLAALAAWVVTAAAGAYLLAGWLAHGDLRLRTAAAGLPPVIASHFTLAVAGLAMWIAFVATALPALAWIAAGLILLVAGFGMATLATALPEPAASAGPALQDLQAVPSTQPVPSPQTGPGPQAVPAGAAAGARPRVPVTVIAVHGVLATTTILLVLLAAVGAG